MIFSVKDSEDSFLFPIWFDRETLGIKILTIRQILGEIPQTTFTLHEFSEKFGL